MKLTQLQSDPGVHLVPPLVLMHPRADQAPRTVARRTRRTEVREDFDGSWLHAVLRDNLLDCSDASQARDVGAGTQKTQRLAGPFDLL